MRKAQQELDLVDKKANDFDAAKYYTVSGVLNSKLNQTKKAIEAYKKAIEATKLKQYKAPKNVTQERYLFSIGGTKDKKKPKVIFESDSYKALIIFQFFFSLDQI